MPQTTDQLKTAIMNLPCKPPALTASAEVWAYQYGPRDARHAAAELVSAVPLVAEAPREPTGEMRWAGAEAAKAQLQWKPYEMNWQKAVGEIYKAMLAAAPSASLAPMPEPTDEQIHALWKNVATYRWQTSEPESLSESVRAFARAVLASVAPQPEQPNTDVHLADNGEQAVQGLDAAAGVPACETCNGEGTIDERLGGYSFSNPAATCPDCGGTGEGPAGAQEAPHA